MSEFVDALQLFCGIVLAGVVLVLAMAVVGIVAWLGSAAWAALRGL